ncbi:MAG: TIGR03960 family B12-binding radical SAM protein, partial [Oscillospiraceae bacterium]|nr:TIGR03960 family B12-binding radical SAM protein [Oscillospiraceae bacterium]
MTGPGAFKFLLPSGPKRSKIAVLTKQRRITGDKRLERILPRVQKPARYVGGEYNEVKKDKQTVDCRFAFCFPDTYEIGMSNLGFRILYGVLNEIPGVWCERVFAPWTDMEEELRKNNIPLWALESGDPVGQFDIVGFSVGYEMAYPAILNMLDLSGIPLRAADRQALAPLVIAGGTAMYNAEPLADFIDLALIGEGEELLPEVVELYRQAKRESWDKPRLLRAAAEIQGVYVPSLYGVSYRGDGAIAAITPLDGAPEKVVKRVVHDMDKSYYPVKTIVPSTEIVHDRVTLEVFRGCIRGCRFCQAGYVYRPVRCRSREQLAEYAQASIQDSGYQEMTLSSLSTSDYPELTGLCDDLEVFCGKNHVNLSLPSLRADNFSMELMQRLQRGRKAGLTFAPEAGTQRLRDAINKNVTEEELTESLKTAFSGGWNAVKLYFMLGLPTETDEDVLGIAEIAKQAVHTWREHASNKNRGLRITVSTSWFVPKPFTAFQWEAQIPRAEYERRVKLLREALTAKA